MLKTIKAHMLMQEGYKPRLDDAWHDLAKQIHKIREKRKNLELEEKLLMDQLVALSKNKNSCNDHFYLQTIIRAGSVQYKLIPELQSVDLEAYRGKPTSYWNLKEI